MVSCQAGRKHTKKKGNFFYLFLLCWNNQIITSLCHFWWALTTTLSQKIYFRPLPSLVIALLTLSTYRNWQQVTTDWYCLIRIANNIMVEMAINYREANFQWCLPSSLSKRPLTVGRSRQQSFWELPLARMIRLHGLRVKTPSGLL